MQLTTEFPPEQLEACLLQLLAPDTSLIKQAEQTLKVYLKQIGCIDGLLIQIEQSQHAQVRQMAAILISKKINTYWERLNETTQQAIKQKVLTRAIQEPERLVRNSLAVVIATIAKHQMVQNKWPELLAFIAECSKHPEEYCREFAMQLFYRLNETIGEHLTAHFEQIKLMFIQALQDSQSIKVRVMAMKAAGSLVNYLSIDEMVYQFQELIPLMLEVLKLCINNGEETEALDFLDILSDIAESTSPVLSPSMVPVVHCLLHILLNETVELGTRDTASYVLIKLLETKPKSLGKKGLVADMANVCLEMIAKDDSSAGGMMANQFDEDPDDDDDDHTPTKIAQRIIDNMALCIPAKYFDDPILKLVAECMNSPDASRRKAGTVTLGVIAEGCADRLRPKIPTILPFLYKSAEENNHLLREASCFALGQWAEHLQPEILEHYDTLLPVVFRLLDDATTTVKGTSCYVLESLTENLEPDAVLPYLEPLMTKLVNLVQTSSPQVQLMAISAIGSTAIGAEDAFVPYFVATANLIRPFLDITDEKLLSLRGRSLECMGYMAIAVGKEAFRPIFAETMHYAILSAKMQDMELCDYCFAFFCNTSKVFEEEFAPYLEQVIPLISDAIKMEDGMTVKSRGDEPQMASFNDSDSEEDEFGSRGHIISVRTAMLDMKAGAVGCIESLAEHTGALFEAFIPLCLQMLASLTEYFHGSVRTGVISALCQMIVVSVEARPMTSDWVKGNPSAVSLAPLTQELLASVMQSCKDFLNDDDHAVVEKTLDGIVKVSEKVGPIATVAILDDVMQAALDILNEEHISQSTGDDEEDDDEDEEVGLLTSVCDLIVCLSKCYGAELDRYFKTLIPALMKYTRGVRPSRDRGTVFGCLAEVSQEIGCLSSQYATEFVPLALTGLTDEDANVRQNCAFCLGIFAEVCGEDMAPHYPALLQGLRPLFDESPDNGGIADNACASVARMIMTSPQSVPMEQVLPVFLDNLPLTVDHTETPTVFKCLLGLLRQQNTHVLNHMPRVIHIFAEALATDANTDEDVIQQIVSCLRWLFESFQTQMQQILDSLSPSQQQTIRLRLGL